MGATGDRNLNITELDFTELRDNLKNYLRGQAYFKDYDFEGSGLSTLLDILAYNTHYQAFYANMVANEMFLDSAVKRNSIVSLAKHLGYTPTSFTAPKATIQVLFPDYSDSSSGTLVLPKHTQFSAKGSDGRQYKFTNMSQLLLDTTATPYGVTTDIYQGTMRYKNFVVDNTNTNQKFIIPDVNIDTTHMVVRVQNSTTDNTGYSDPWTLAGNHTEIKSTDTVYFLQENQDGFFEITFGDNLVGKQPADGNLISIEYLITDGPFANGIGNNEYYSDASEGLSGDTFSCSLANTTNVYVISPSNGGALVEDEKSIKYYAPLNYQAQDRAVTALDYQATIAKQYPAAESISVWGGEDNDPPFYGRVMISIKPNEGLRLTSSEKESIVGSILKSKNIVTVRPLILDPEYTYLKVNSEVAFTAAKTGLSPEDLRVAVIRNIKNYMTNDLEKFDTNLLYSRFVDMIDDTNSSITNNYTTVDLEKRFIPLTGQDVYKLDFQNALHHPHEGHSSVTSSNGFFYKIPDDPTTFDNEEQIVTAYLDDDGMGKLRLYRIDVDGNKVYFDLDCGSIDYSSGVLSFKDFYPITEPAQEVRVVVKPNKYDVTAIRNNILTMDNTDPRALTVSMVENGRAESFRVTNTDFYTSEDNNVTNTNSGFGLTRNDDASSDNSSSSSSGSGSSSSGSGY